MHARGVRARTHARVGGWVEVGIAQTRRENHILFYSSLSNGASKLSYQLKLILHCKVQYFGKAHNCCGTDLLLSIAIAGSGPSILRLLKVRVSSSGVKDVTDGQDTLPRASLFDDQLKAVQSFTHCGDSVLQGVIGNKEGGRRAINGN